MKVEKLLATAEGRWMSDAEPVQADFVLYFGTRDVLEDGGHFADLRERYPLAKIIGCSTGGQIVGDDVTDEITTAVAVEFASTDVRLSVHQIEQNDHSRACGQSIGRDLAAPGLAGVFLISDGLCVNGSALTAGLVSEIGGDIPITGGLAGDGSVFEKTLVAADATPKPNIVAAVGFYGSKVKFGTGTAGGWDEFGPRRTITRSAGNVLHELDGQPALDLYIRYLGEEAEGLPGTALLFPLRVFNPEKPDHDIVRTVLSVDRDSKTMTFAGDVPLGWTVQLMRGRFDQLAAGAANAARQACVGTAGDDGVAILVSCIGRRLLMDQLVSDEIDAALAEIGGHAAVLGFYSYGEIAPHPISRLPELHNQTMTITTITEAA
ncbi:MAG: FIST signal transduction protein [Geminicoccaceae bacterium]